MIEIKIDKFIAYWFIAIYFVTHYEDYIMGTALIDLELIRFWEWLL